MSGGLTAAGLVVLLLALIGSGVGIYYAYICLQARPLRPKKHKDAEHGPLIPPDPDVNGNHEDVPHEASAPLEEDANEKLCIDEPDHAPAAPAPKPEEKDSPNPPKEKEDILISVEDDAPPVLVMHEKETAPITNHPAPLGFVVPNSVPSPQETPLDHHSQPLNVQPQLQPQPQLESQPQSPPQPKPQPEPESQAKPTKIDAPPLPVYIPPPQQKKPMAISDEEDGLLLQEPSPQDDTFNPELSATLPVSHSPRQPVLREEPKATPQNEPPVCPSKTEAQPVIMVVPSMTPSYPEKEEMKPVGKSLDPLISENCDKPAPLYMKEDDEHLPSAITSQDTNEATPINIKEAEPILGIISHEMEHKEPKDPINKKISVASDDSLSIESPHDKTQATPECVGDTEAAESLQEDKTETDIPTDDAKVHEEPRPDSPCSLSSEETDPPHCAISEVSNVPEASPESPCQAKEVPEEAVTVDSHASPQASPEAACDNPTPNITEEHLPQAASEDIIPNVIVHSSADEDDTVSEASSDSSDAVDDDPNIHAEAIVTNDPNSETDKDASASPSQPPVTLPIDAASVPMEAISALPDDISDEESSALPVIREEGSAENNSDGTDTESSEPEVTEYSFSSGPSAPSTTGVLANEVSCTLEPKVTKIITFNDVKASESEDSEISEEDLEEDCLTSPSDSDEEIPISNMPSENKPSQEEKSPSPTEKGNTVSDLPDHLKQNISLADKGDLSSNGPVVSESSTSTPDAANNLPLENISDSGDSETESEGAEAEVEVKEEMVSIPAVVCNNANNHDAEPQANPATNHTGSLTDTCPPKAQTLNSPRGNGNSLEENTTVTDEGDGLSVSTSESCDLSDGELTTSTPKKSMIPRLVKQSEA